jgi:hypothetical protein
VDENQPETQPPGFLGVWKRRERESVGSCVYYLSCYGIASDMASLWNRGLFLLQLEMLTNDPARRIVCVSPWLFARLTCFPVWTFGLSFFGFQRIPLFGFQHQFPFLVFQILEYQLSAFQYHHLFRFRFLSLRLPISLSLVL